MSEPEGGWDPLYEPAAAERARIVAFLREMRREFDAEDPSRGIQVSRSYSLAGIISAIEALEHHREAKMSEKPAKSRNCDSCVWFQDCRSIPSWEKHNNSEGYCRVYPTATPRGVWEGCSLHEEGPPVVVTPQSRIDQYWAEKPPENP